ncbi:MAG: hypothetical protein JWN35_1872 [Frankiales bacterium]|nr:hypothetical protein [Frankiales bacterium]
MRDHVPTGHPGRVLSLVNSPALCFDLVRLPGGASAAAVLATALNAGPEDLDRLERLSGHDTPARAAIRSAARSVLDDDGAPPVVAAMAAVAAVLPAPPPVDLVISLRTAPLLRPVHLLTLLQEVVLDWTTDRSGDLMVQRWPRAVGYLGDALLGALAVPAFSPEDAALLGAPLRAADLDAGPGDLGPQSGELLRLIDSVTALDDERTAALAEGHFALGGWALDIHRACWAVDVTRRERAAARAQVALAGALATRDDRWDLAGSGAVAALSGAVHATVVADILDTDTYQRLVHPWESAAL